MALVLIVDDSEATAIFVEATLEPRGHRVLAARHAGEITAIEGPAPDLVLLDLHIPGWSHERILEELHARWPDPVPVVIHSSFPEERIRDAIERIGAVGGVSKGLGPDELEAALAPYFADDSEGGSDSPPPSTQGSST